MRPILALATISSLFVAQNAFAQATSYDQMFNASMQNFNNLNSQIEFAQQGVINRSMANPQVQAMYRQHQAQGGRMSPQEFAYWHAATRGFSTEGMRQFRQNEANNQAGEMNAWRGWQAAQQNRAAAQTNYMNSYQANNTEFGNMLNGNSTYTNPYTGQPQVLPHTQQNNSYYRDTAGNVYYRDGTGNYHMSKGNGYWSQMNSR